MKLYGLAFAALAAVAAAVDNPEEYVNTLGRLPDVVAR
jgi:hypothetical protein